MEFYTGDRVKRRRTIRRGHDENSFDPVKATVAGTVFWGAGIGAWYLHVVFDDGRMEEAPAGLFELDD